MLFHVSLHRCSRQLIRFLHLCRSLVGKRLYSWLLPLLVLLPLLLISIGLGTVLAHTTVAQSEAIAPPLTTPMAQTTSIGTVDPIPPRFALGQRIYLQTCATCHIGLPPAVLPTETWRRLLQDAQHYSVVLTPLVDPDRLLVWTYLQTYSRPLTPQEATPFRLANSRFMKALHPKVELPRPLTLSSCVSCHPGAAQYNFRSLTSTWENSP